MTDHIEVLQGLVDAAKLAAKINPFGSVENADARDAAIAALAAMGAMGAQGEAREGLTYTHVPGVGDYPTKYVAEHLPEFVPNEHHFLPSPKYGGEICSQCGAVKGTRRGKEVCRHPRPTDQQPETWPSPPHEPECAAPQQPEAQEPPAIAEYVLALLIAGGFVTQAKADEARKIALGIAPGPLSQPEARVIGWVEKLDAGYDEIHRLYGEDGRKLVQRIPFGYPVAILPTGINNWHEQPEAQAGGAVAWPAPTFDVDSTGVVAYMVPRILSFKNALRTSCPEHLQAEIEGTVCWEPDFLGDSHGVVDKHGVRHMPRPLIYGDTAPPPSAVPEGSEIVGHKTIDNGRGGFRHEPLTRAEADALIAHCHSEDERRKALMPDERSALRMMMDAHTRLTDMGWRDPVYCPKDGSTFEVIEPGSTGIHKCIYMGEWPSGSWWVLGGGDMWPSRPVLFRPLAAAPEPKEKE